MAEGCAEYGEGVEEQEGRWMRDGRGEGGLNRHSATCYLVVAITGSNVK